jgi:hypothetical protein
MVLGTVEIVLVTENAVISSVSRQCRKERIFLHPSLVGLLQ